MSGPKGWTITVGPQPSSILAEVLNCHQVWSWLTKPQRVALKGASEGGRVAGGVVVLRNLREHGLIDEAGLLTAAGRLVLGWNDEDSGPWRERLKELRRDLGTGALPEVPESNGSTAHSPEVGTRVR